MDRTGGVRNDAMPAAHGRNTRAGRVVNPRQHLPLLRSYVLFAFRIEFKYCYVSLRETLPCYGFIRGLPRVAQRPDRVSVNDSFLLTQSVGEGQGIQPPRVIP
jgi:hypothetical protein